MNEQRMQQPGVVITNTSGRVKSSFRSDYLWTKVAEVVKRTRSCWEDTGSVQVVEGMLIRQARLATRCACSFPAVTLIRKCRCQIKRLVATPLGSQPDRLSYGSRTAERDLVLIEAEIGLADESTKHEAA